MLNIINHMSHFVEQEMYQYYLLGISNAVKHYMSILEQITYASEQK
jgi:hypothetical protein